MAYFWIICPEHLTNGKSKVQRETMAVGSQNRAIPGLPGEVLPTHGSGLKWPAQPLTLATNSGSSSEGSSAGSTEFMRRE